MKRIGKMNNIMKIVLCTVMMLTVMVIGSNTVKASTLYRGDNLDSEGNNAEQNSKKITDSDLIGRYGLNYTGNINYFTGWLVGAKDGEPGGPMKGKNTVYNDLNFSSYRNYSDYQKGITQYYTKPNYWTAETDTFNSNQIKPNSSTATLTPLTDNAKIVAAYLIWYTRDSGGLFTFYDDPVCFATPNGQRIWVTPNYACTDTRYGIDSYLCMSANVTDIVKNAGYGTYGVANIPYWFQTNGTVAGSTGGNAFGGWQLVIVEESTENPVRAVKIEIGSTYAKTGYTGILSLSDGLQTKPSGDSDAQVFFSGIFANDTVMNGTRTYTYNTLKSYSGSTLLMTLTSGKLESGQFYNYGTNKASRDTIGLFATTRTFANIGSNATKIQAICTAGTQWDSYCCFGMAVDLAFPTLEGQQKTTVNSDNSVVTVTGGYHNVTEDSDTGIGGGKLVVTLDNELTAKSSTLTLTYADGATKTVNGTYNNADKTVTFQGVDLQNKGDKCSYTIECNITGTDDEKFYNRDELSGYLYSNGAAITGYPIEKASSSYSYLYLIVKVSLDPQGSAIDGGTVKSAGTSCYYEYYNVGNYADKAHKTKITRITIPTKTGCVFAGYYTGKNGTGKQYVRADGTITSTATTFTEDTTLYAKWEPGVYKITLDGINPTTQGTACYYEKYTVGNFADEACTTKITRITLPAKRGYTFDGYWTKRGGDAGGGNICVTTAGAICTRANQFTQDTTIYANWNPNRYTITLDNQGATASGSACFYELYDTNFFYDAIVQIPGTVTVPYDYTGNVQYFTAPYTGTYFLDVYGAQGSSTYAAGGYGGRSYGCINLAQGETIYIYVGGAGYEQTGGYNGGANGGSYSTWWYVAGGGGATDIRRGGTDLWNRAVIAGGGGGSARCDYGYSGSVPGGNGGGTEYQGFYVLSAYDSGVFYGTAWSTGVSGIKYNTAQLGTASGIGGGGGYYGGRAKDNNNYVPAGEGGTGYISGITAGYVGGAYYGAASLGGQKTGNGYAAITRSNYTTTYTATTKIEAPLKTGYYFRGYYTGANGTGTAITDSQGNILVEPDYFASNTIVYAYWAATPAANYTIVYNGNGATSGSMANATVPVDAGYTLNKNLYERTGYQFAGWSSTPSGSAEYRDKAVVYNLAGANQTKTLYAVWTPVKYTIRFHGNGATGGSMADMSCEYGKTYTLTRLGYEKTGYHFVKWTTNMDGTGAGYSDGQSVSNLASADGAIVHLYAQWEANQYTIHFDPNGGGEVTPIPNITVRYEDELAFPDASGAYVKYTLDGVNVTQKVLDGDIILDDTGAVVMMLDEETGTFMTPDGAVVNEDGSISRVNGDGTVTVTYPDGNAVVMDPDGNAVVMDPDGNAVVMDPDGTVTQKDGEIEAERSAGTTGEPEGTGMGTEDTGTAGETENTGTTQSGTEEEQTETSGDSAETGNSETASVEQNAVNRTATAADGTEVDQELQETGDTGADTADAPAAQAETEEEADAEPQPDKKAYASVFMGWSLAEGKDGFIPQWTAGTVFDIATLVEAAGVTDQNGATITLYAVWDDCPWIQAVNLYYTLEQAQSGFITQEEILSHATASDREDGCPIAPGFHENGTSFSIPDYAPTDFTQFQHEGSCTENLTVVDSVGSMYGKQITVYVVDTTAVAVKPEGTTRFINEYYYNQPYENGGLEENSIWKTEPEYRTALETAFSNAANDTPIASYRFTHNEILQMKEFVEKNGIGNSRSENAVSRFIGQFMQ